MTNVSGRHGWIWHGYEGWSFLKPYGGSSIRQTIVMVEMDRCFDCLDLPRTFKKAMNKTLVRTAQSQYNTYQHVSSSNIKKGDLVFFGSSKSSVTHTGIYIGSGKMLDAQNNGVITEKIAAPWWNLVGYARPATIS